MLKIAQNTTVGNVESLNICIIDLEPKFIRNRWPGNDSGIIFGLVMMGKGLGYKESQF